VRRRRATVVAGVALAIATLTLVPAYAAAIPPQRLSPGPVLTGSDANDLASSLADAGSTQGVCYGWDVNVNDSSGGPSGTDAGSSKDPNSTTPALQCPRYVILRANVNYTCNSCEAEDSASYSIQSNLPNPPTGQDLDNLGVGSSGMLENNNDNALINSVQALPLVVSDKGEARPVRAALIPKPPNSPDHPTGTGSDNVHPSVLLLALGGALLIIGLLLWWMGRSKRRRERANAGAGPGAPTPQAS
jgi:hypothetical protein